MEMIASTPNARFTPGVKTLTPVTPTPDSKIRPTRLTPAEQAYARHSNNATSSNAIMTLFSNYPVSEGHPND